MKLKLNFIVWNKMKIFLFILMVQFSFLNVVEMASKNAVTLEMQGSGNTKNMLEVKDST